jgi:hypothetical protein
MIFVFDVLYGRVGSPNLLSVFNVIATRYRTQVGEPLNDVVRQFNEVAGLLDFHLSRNQFFYRLGSVLLSRPTLHFLLDNTVHSFFFVVSIYLRFELLIL